MQIRQVHTVIDDSINTYLTHAEVMPFGVFKKRMLECMNSNRFIGGYKNE